MRFALCISALVLATGCNPAGSSDLPDGSVDLPPEDGGYDAGVLALADDSPPVGKDPLRWNPTGALQQARMNHTATLLPSRRVLVVGGETYARTQLASIEEYDADTGVFTQVAALPQPRSNHTATLLKSGRVLIAGGGPANVVGLPNGGSGVTATSLEYDPVTHALQEVGALAAPRQFHSAFLLSDGRVIVVGGGDASSIQRPLQGTGTPGQVGAALATTEIYSPEQHQWSPGPAMAVPRYAFAAARLADGRLLVAGGANQDAVSFASSEILDLAQNAWTPAGDMSVDRLFLAMARLGDGSMLVLGGKRSNIAFLSSAERFEAATRSWSAVPPAPQVTTMPTLTTLSSGNALRVGGLSCPAGNCQTLSTAAVFVAASKTWTPVASLRLPRAGHTTTVLPDGDVLVAGGYSNDALEHAEAERGTAR